MTNETKAPDPAAPVVAASELSDEQIMALYCQNIGLMGDTSAVKAFARAVLAAATPAASDKARALLTITGTLVELGDMRAGRGFAVETSESTYVELIGLSEQGVQDVASEFYSAVTIIVLPAAPTQAEGQ